MRHVVWFVASYCVGEECCINSVVRCMQSKYPCPGMRVRTKKKSFWNGSVQIIPCLSKSLWWRHSKRKSYTWFRSDTTHTTLKKRKIILLSCTDAIICQIYWEENYAYDTKTLPFLIWNLQIWHYHVKWHASKLARVSPTTFPHSQLQTTWLLLVCDWKLK